MKLAIIIALALTDILFLSKVTKKGYPDKFIHTVIVALVNVMAFYVL